MRKYIKVDPDYSIDLPRIDYSPSKPDNPSLVANLDLSIPVMGGIECRFYRVDLTTQHEEVYIRVKITLPNGIARLFVTINNNSISDKHLPPIVAKILASDANFEVYEVIKEQL